MKRFVLVATLFASTLACSKPGRSLVLVDLQRPDGSSITHARVSVMTLDNHSLGLVEDDFGADTTLHFGVYVPRSVSGMVKVVACGLAGTTPTAEVTGTASVEPGQSSSAQPMPMVLSAGMLDGLCAQTDGGAAGGDGGGSGGGAGAAGGADAGAGSGGAGTGGGTDAGAGTSGTAGAGGAGGTGPGTGGAGGMAGGGAGAGGGPAGAGGGAGAVHVPTWGPARVVSDNSALAEIVPHVAVGSTGKAVAVFERGNQIFSNSYDPATTNWGTPVLIDPRPQTAEEPLIVVDKNDTYLVVWQQDPNDTAKGIYWSTSTDLGAHWTAPAAITTTQAFGAAVAINPDGVAIVAWTESTPDFWQLGTSFRAGPGMAWSAPVTFKANEFENGERNPAVAVSGKGEAFVIWNQDDMGAADQLSVFEMHHTAAGWSSPKLFETYDGAASFMPSVAANAAGIVIATWIEVGATAATKETLRARRWAFGGNDFGPPVEVASGVFIDNFLAPALVLDESGKAVVAWAFEIQSKWQVFAGRTDGTAAVLPDIFALDTDDAAAYDNDMNDPAAGATMPALVIDPAGNTTLTWRKRTNLAGSKYRFDAWSRRLLHGADAWTNPTLIETRDIGSVEWPALGVGADGTVVAVWDYTVEPDVWAAVLR